MRHGARLQPLWLAFLLMLTLLPAAPTSAQAYPLIVHNDPSYAGSWCYSDTPMAANIAASCNDQISSIQLQAGWSVRVNRDQNQSGPSFCLSRSDNNLGDNTFEDGSPADNAISSFALYSGAWCGGSPTPAYPLEVYNDPGYGGSQCYSWRAETATIFSLCDNQISSILLRAGWSIRLYAEPGQAGPSRCLTGSDSNLADNTFENGAPMDNAASSFVLYSVGSCGGGSNPDPQPTYTISGRVVAPGSGQGIPGVSISATGPTGVNTITNDQGYYTLSGLPAGGYQMSAERAGVEFPAVSRNVQLPPSNTTVNFTALKGKVIVLVHGWQGLSRQLARYHCNNGIYTNAVTDFGPLPTLLRERGYLVYLAQWTTGMQSTMQRPEAATCLANQIGEVAKHDTDGKVLLIGHSMGGLVSRSYIEGQAYKGNVERLITVGTPHVGINLSKIAMLSPWYTLPACNSSLLDGTCELSFWRTLAYNLTHRQPANVRYDFVSGRGGTNLPGLGYLSITEGEHDKIVGRYSGQGYTTVVHWLRSPSRGFRSVQGGDIPIYWTLDQHEGANGYFGKESAGGIRCVLRLLGEQGICDRDLPTSSGQAILASEVPALHITEAHTATLTSGETRTFSLTLDGAAAEVSAAWETGDLRMTLHGPDGVELTPETIGAALPGATYTTSEVGSVPQIASYFLPQVTPGNWQVTITATADTMVSVFGTVRSDLEAAFELPGAVPVGVSTTVSVKVTTGSSAGSAAVQGATVEGVLHTAAGPVTLIFSETAAGTYSARFSTPQEPGEYALVVTASGETPQPFERRLDETLFVLHAGATVAGTASSAVSDLDADGRFDALRVQVPLAIAAAGEYSVGARLYGPDGAPVAQTQQAYSWEAGEQQLTLDLAGSDIAASGIDGPYVLALTLVQADGEKILLDTPELHRTARYRSSDFAEGTFQIYMPLLKR